MLQMFQLLSDSNDISIDSFHVIYDSDVTVFLNWSGSVSLIWLRSFCCWEMGNNNLFFKNSLNLSLAAGLQHCWSARMEMTIRCIFCQLCGLVWQLIMEEDALEAMKKYLTLLAAYLIWFKNMSVPEGQTLIIITLTYYSKNNLMSRIDS